MKKLMIALLLTLCFSTGNSFTRGDADMDGLVTVSDVAALINYLLNGAWPEGNAEVFTVNGVSFAMIQVDGGTFMMGATSEQGSEAQSNEYPVHRVSVSSFSIGQTEVTQELWIAVMNTNPSYFSGTLQLPVEQVTYADCQEFITRLNAMTGRQFRLPTEAEWEFAARGGNLSHGYMYSGNSNPVIVAWIGANSGNKTHDVATREPNELGIYDMSGNVWEWCNDWYSDYTSENQTNPTGPSTGDRRLIRGGGYAGAPYYCRVSYRSNPVPGEHYRNLGFRIAL